MYQPIHFRAFEKPLQLIILGLLLAGLQGCGVPVCCSPPVPEEPMNMLARAGSVDSPVIASLLQQADELMDAGQWSKAASVLERALRINTRQAETWFRLAWLSLQQGKASQAIERARRAMSYGEGRDSLLALDWQLMAKAYDMLGQEEQAAQARQKSRAYSGAMD